MCLSLLHMNAGINHPFQQVFLFTHLLCLLPVGLGSLDTEVGDFLLVHHPSVVSQESVTKVLCVF